MTDKRIESVPASLTDRMFDFGPRLFFIGSTVTFATETMAILRPSRGRLMVVISGGV